MSREVTAHDQASDFKYLRIMSSSHPELVSETAYIRVLRMYM